MRLRRNGAKMCSRRSSRPPSNVIHSADVMRMHGILLLLCVALAGCSDTVTDAQWAKTLPGVYEGAQSGFVERVEFRLDGSFRHEVTVYGKPLVAESGKWSFYVKDVKRGAVEVEPFTSAWDYSSHTLTTNVIFHPVEDLFVMRYGQAVERISPSVQFKYQLIRKQSNSTP